MAESVLSFVVEELGNHLIEEAVFLHGVPDQIEWVKRELTRMQCFLKYAEAKRRKGDERVQNWICEVRDVAYQVENVIDTIRKMIEKRQSRRGGFIGFISRYAHKPKELKSRYKIGVEIQQIKKKIGEISDSRATYGINNLDESGDEENSAIDDSLQARRRLFPHSDEDRDVVGFEFSNKALMEQLLDLNNARLCVISIVGMGGAGKTTLASRIYNTPAIRRHFSVFSWLSVSQNYSRIGLLSDIHEKIIGTRMDQHEEYVRKKIFEFLKGKRYLIVLDDVWKDDVWQHISDLFPNNNNGSRLILTTRNIDVAKSADPITPPHVLGLLNDEESWELFCKKAFPGNLDTQTRCPEELEGLSRQLARRCGGLPLALVVLGGLLSRKEQTYPVWLAVTESLVWESTTDGQQCLAILALSYNDLPHHYLKSCFIYISSFPEDTAISVTTLTRLWIAEGFIPPRPRQTQEETAREYLDELVQRCMVQVADRSLAHGWIKKIRIHDLLRDLCISEARKDRILSICGNSADVSSSSSSTMKAPRLAVHNLNATFPTFIPELHSLLVFGGVNLFNYPNKLKWLRVFHVDCYQHLPLKIKSEIHLRYLVIRAFPFTDYLSSTRDLCNLITLDVTNVKQVPDIIWNIPTLRHLYNRNDPIEPPITFSLLNLQVLWTVHNGQWIEESLANHTNLRKLGIFLDSTSHHEELTTSLQKLDRLITLQLKSSTSIPVQVLTIFRNQHHLHVLKLYGHFSNRFHLPPSSEFPPKLTKLILCYCHLEHDPMPILEKLPNLVCLRLEGAYAGNSMSCSIGGFPRLQFLRLHSLDFLEDWRVADGAMPRLTQLEITECMCLTMLPEGLTSLCKLKLSDMSKEFMDRVREDCGEDWYKIRHIPSIIRD